MSSPMAQLLDEARCLVCVGPGGVGKTSTSAALAIEAGRRGRRTVVLTIDPARRLANALGLPEIGSVERDLPPSAFTEAGLEPPRARVSAAMLDIAEAWDEMVRTHHPDPEQRERLLNNRLYHALSTALAGSQEYMAMEKLHRLAERPDDRPDLIVLDTPPATHALDFLEAPSKIIDALDNDATRWILEAGAPGRRRRLLDSGSSLFLKTIARFTGMELLQELAELLSAFSAMFDGWRDRARAVQDLLAAEGTRFCVVGSPTPLGRTEAEAFVLRLRERSLRVGGLVLNRATPELPPADPDAFRAAAAELDPAWVELLVSNAQAQAARAGEERAGAEALKTRLGLRPVVVPELEADVQDLASLDALGHRLLT